MKPNVMIKNESENESQSKREIRKKYHKLLVKT